MFISESYIHFQDDFSHNVEGDEFVDISFDLRPFRRYSNTDNENTVIKSKYLSKSADLVYRKKKLNSSHGYDGDTDSDVYETPVETTTTLATCEICRLDFMHDILDSIHHKDFGVKKRKWKRKSKNSSNHIQHHKTSSSKCVDFEDYKDATHKMEVFAPDSERKWTLQYHYNGERDLPMLSKVIIGRGQKNQYPELNNIHLIQELKDYAQYEWRNNWLDNLKSRNKIIKESFALIPSTNTCLFCFHERNNDILQNIKNNSLHAFNLPFCILDECLKDLNTEESRKYEDQQNRDNIYNNDVDLKEYHPPQLLEHEVQNLEKKQLLNEKETPRNGIIDHTLTNQTEETNRKFVRSNSLSDKVYKKFSKRKVDIELSNKLNDQCSIQPRANECSKEAAEMECVKLDEIVNVVLMYTEKTDTGGEHNQFQPNLQKQGKPRNGIINKIQTHAKDKKEKLEISTNVMDIDKSEIIQKSQQQNEITHINDRRKISRTLSDKLFRKRKYIDKEQNYNDDDEEDFVIIM